MVRPEVIALKLYGELVTLVVVLVDIPGGNVPPNLISGSSHGPEYTTSMFLMSLPQLFNP